MKWHEPSILSIPSVASMLLITRPHSGSINREFEQAAVEKNRFSKSLISKRCNFRKIEVYHVMLNDKPNVLTELAPK